jgi:hypothetical protein
LRKTSQLTTETTKEVPPALKAEFQAKAKTLAQLEESYALTGKYDDVMKGRKTGFETGVGQGVLAGAIPAGQGSAAVAAASGKQMLNTEGGETYNMYTGESTTTPLGKAQINKENAQAGELGALGKKYGKEIEKIDAEIAGGMFNKNSSERLTSMLNAANAFGNSLSKQKADGSISKDRLPAWQEAMDKNTALQAKLSDMLGNAADAKANPPAPKSDTSEKPTPPPPVVKALPAGAVLIGKSGGKNVYQLPNGSRYQQQ